MQQTLFKNIKNRHFPSTRYQGSKRKLLPKLEEIFRNINFTTVLDLYSGSGSVSYLLRSLDKKVTANDYLLYNSITAKVFLTQYTLNEIESAIHNFSSLVYEKPKNEITFVRDLYENVFFTNEENKEIDFFCSNITNMNSKDRNLYIYVMGQSLLKKRPFNLFHRANLNTRLADVKRSFGNKKTWETSINDHSIKTLKELKKLNLNEYEEGIALNIDTINLIEFPKQFDLIYLDPPYISKNGTAIDYNDFYFFLDGLVDYNLFNSFDNRYAHKPFTKSKSNWTSHTTSLDALKEVLLNWKNSHIVFSYRNDGLFTTSDIENTFKECNREYETKILSNYKYALSNTENTNEIIILAKPT
jgi:adenine-specific DNA-methyltransferase